MRNRVWVGDINKAGVFDVTTDRTTLIRITRVNLNIGNIRYFGQMGTLHVVLARYRQQLYKSTLRARVNGYEFTRLLPPPKGSGRSL